MGQKASKPAHEPPVAEQRNVAPSAQVVAPSAPTVTVKERRSPPRSVVKESSKQQPTASPAALPPSPPIVKQSAGSPSGQAGKAAASVQVGTSSTMAKSKAPVTQKQQIHQKHQSPVPILPPPKYPPATQKSRQSAQKSQQPAQAQQSAQKQHPNQQQTSSQKQPAVQKQPVPQKVAKQQSSQPQPSQHKQSVQGKPQNTHTQPGKAAKQPKQKKGGKQGQQQQQPRPTHVPAAKSKAMDHTKLPSKPASQPVGGSLRARMSSPPKLINAQVTTKATSTVSTSSLSAPVPSSKLNPSDPVGRMTEKRRLEEVDITPSISKPNNLPTKSPQGRAPKVARRDGDMDTSSALSLRAKPPSPSPPPAMLSRLTMDVDDEKEEGEISDEEMQEPSPPPTGKASLLERLRDAPVSVHPSSPAVSSTSGIGSLEARMDPALMARIDPRTSTEGPSNRLASRVSPVVPPAVAAQARYQAHVQARSSSAFGQSSTKCPVSPSTVNPAAAASFFASSSSVPALVPVSTEQQPRTKGVIGRSGNMTTVNGVAISTSDGQGESQLDEEGQRELIEIVVELHNKGIPSDELIQQGVPAQLVNRVMKALSKPAPTADTQPAGIPPSSRIPSARQTSLPPKPVADLPPKPTVTSTMSGSNFAHPEVDHDADVDMDIDDSEHEKSPQMASGAPFVSSAPGFMFLPPMHMMHMPFPPASVEPTLPIPSQHFEPSAPPLPPVSGPQPPPPPPVEPKLSLKEMKAKLLASRKTKQQSAMETDGTVLQPSDVNTPTFDDVAGSMATTPRLHESLWSSKTVVQDVMQNILEKTPSPPSPIPASFVPSATTSRLPSPKSDFEILPASAVPNSAHSRRPGAADFVDAPPSRLASSTFFRSNARKTFAPPQPKRLVVDLDDTSDESGTDGDDDEYDGMRQSESELYMDEATSLRLVHEAELRIALERKKAELAEKRAKLAAYAARKQAAAQLAAETATGNGSVTPDPQSIGLSVTPPAASESALATPTLEARVGSIAQTHVIPITRIATELTDAKSNMTSNRTQDKGKQREGAMTKSPLQAIAAASSSSAHFKPYQFFTPPPPTSSIRPNAESDTDILDSEALKKITLSRMMAEHRQRTGKAEDDPVVCKYELRGGACNDPDCPDFHMERDVVASHLVLPAKKTSPPHTATVRQHLHQLIRSKPDVPPKTLAAASPEVAKSGIEAKAAVLKAKLKRQRQAKALQERYQARKADVEQFLNEMRKSLRDRASSAGASAK
ncbi:hypothetical protein QFC22_004649 [Naganishia vaughanmartiniae]|uniref:Uncharacterized protein n=1 Tax=Naganishia vaughanmartiniae TaxID=1424756 RepID=A0ACC2X021_9TREE|nr:hypothetical protein QFC22_004649 [Naganishia vaughanmartiniae]